MRAFAGAPAARPARRPVTPAVIAVATVAVVFAVFVPARQDSIEGAAGLANQPAFEAAPRELNFAGVRFPRWDRLGWQPTGARRDLVAGRATDTVYYQH